MESSGLKLAPLKSSFVSGRVIHFSFQSTRSTQHLERLESLSNQPNSAQPIPSVSVSLSVCACVWFRCIFGAPPEVQPIGRKLDDDLI